MIARLAPTTRLLLDWWLVLAGALGLTTLAVLQAWTVRLDFPAYDLALSQLGRPLADHDTVIVAVDETSLARFGAWPWPRATQARLVERIAESRARSIGLDVLLIDPRNPAGDAALAGAIASATSRGVRVALPAAFRATGMQDGLVTVEPPLSLFTRAGAAIGHANLTPDRDGTVRRFHAVFGTGGRSWPALGAAMLGIQQGGEARVAASRTLTGTAPLLIAYPPGGDGFPRVSAAALMTGRGPEAALAGRNVLVGLTASGLGDYHATPVDGGRLMSGVEIQAAVLNTLRLSAPVRPAAPGAATALALVPVVVLFVAMRVLRPALTGLAALLLAAASIGISAALLRFGSIWVSPVTPVLAMALAWPIWAWVRLVVTGRYIAQELEFAAGESGSLIPVPAGSSVLDRELALLQAAATRERQLRAEHDEVIRLLSHDMRAPQSAILALTEPGQPIGAEVVQRVRDNARRTLALADGFVQLSRAQLLEWHPQIVDLSEIARDAADGVWVLGRDRGIEIEVAGPPDGTGDPNPVLVAGEPSLLQRAIANLAENAIKYGADGEEVRIVVSREGGKARVDVINRGVDVPPSLRASLFERFQRADAEASRGNGAGLGLAFVHAVAVRHGGRADCRSEGGTTRFSLILPLVGG